jgi:hypothetical protein
VTDRTVRRFFKTAPNGEPLHPNQKGFFGEGGGGVMGFPSKGAGGESFPGEEGGGETLTRKDRGFVTWVREDGDGEPLGETGLAFLKVLGPDVELLGQRLMYNQCPTIIRPNATTCASIGTRSGLSFEYQIL